MLLFNKILPLFVLPFGVVCGLVLVTLWRKKWWPGLLALVVLGVCSMPLVADQLIGWLETRYPEIPLAELPRESAVVVLGGILGPKVPGSDRTNWSESVERFEAGVALVQAGKADWLVFTGARFAWENGASTEGEELRKEAIIRGVPAEKILVTRDVDNTASEARAVAEMMRANGWKRVILVTTGWHMPRAAMLFRRAGVDCVFFPVDFRRSPKDSLTVIDFVPNAGAWQETETALREGYGYLFYRLFH